MASFKKFKVGNTSYDVKDANAGYSLSVSNGNVNLKNAAGTVISSVAVSGMDYNIIADEFDTTPTVVPGQGHLYHYSEYVTRTSGGSPSECYKNIYGDVESGTWDSSKWEQQTNFVQASTSTWVNANALVCDVVHGKKFYLCTNQYGGAMFDPYNIDQTNFLEVPEFDTTPYQPGGTTYHQYDVGDYVIYNNNLYRCKSATTGAAWMANAWLNTKIMNEFSYDVFFDWYYVYSQGSPAIDLMSCSTMPGTIQLKYLNDNSYATCADIFSRFALGKLPMLYCDNEAVAVLEVDYIHDQLICVCYDTVVAQLITLTDDGHGRWTKQVISGGATSLNGLTDVNLTTPQNNQILTYDSTSSKWKNKDLQHSLMIRLNATTITSAESNCIKHADVAQAYTLVNSIPKNTLIAAIDVGMPVYLCANDNGERQLLSRLSSTSSGIGAQYELSYPDPDNNRVLLYQLEVIFNVQASTINNVSMTATRIISM